MEVRVRFYHDNDNPTNDNNEEAVVESCGCVFADIGIECRNPDCKICEKPK